MMSCKRAAALSSERMDRKLTLREHLALHIHLMACRMCNQYSKQLDFIRQASRLFDARDSNRRRMDDAAKERIRSRLKDL